jgi:hypothetical protein
MADRNHVFRASPGTPSGTQGCRDAGQVEALLKEFASAFNSGDAAALRATLSTEIWAVSLSVRGRHDVAYSRDDAVRYLLERHQEGDRLDFVRVQVNELVGWDGAAHVGPVAFVLNRADATVGLDGKGALYCGGTAKGIKVLGLTG